MGWLTFVVSAAKFSFGWVGDVLLGHERSAADHDHVIRQYVDFYSLPDAAEDAMRGVVGKLEDAKSLAAGGPRPDGQF